MSLELKRAIKALDYEQVAGLLKGGIDGDAYFPVDPMDGPFRHWDETPLGAAIDTGDVKMVELLIENKADVHRLSSQCTALELCGIGLKYTDDVERVRRYCRIARLLIGKGFDVGLKNKDGQSAGDMWNDAVKHKAEVLPLEELKECVIKKGGSTSSDVLYGTLTLAEAVTYKTIEPLQVVLESKPDINAQDGYGMTALMLAGFHKNWAGCRLLVDSGADVNLRNQKGYALIHYLAEVGDSDTEDSYTKANELMAYVISKGARIEEKGAFNNSPNTPLLIASKMNNWLGCRTLIDHGAEVDEAMDYLQVLRTNRKAMELLTYIQSR